MLLNVNRIRRRLRDNVSACHLMVIVWREISAGIESEPFKNKQQNILSFTESMLNATKFENSVHVYLTFML